MNGNNVIEKFVKYLLLTTIGLSALIFVAILILDEKTIESTAGPAAEMLVEIKHDVEDTAVDKSSKFVYWVRTSIQEIMNFSITDRTPRVVMRIPPPPENLEPATQPAAMAGSKSTTVAEQGNAESKPVEKLSPASVPIPGTMPAAPQPAPSMNTDAAKAPAQEQTSPPPAPAPMPSAMGFGKSAQKGAPPPVPVVPVTEQPLTEQASLPSAEQAPIADTPPPPPAVKEARPGEADYLQGLKFYNGEGVKQNFGKAAQFFMKAGEAGHVGAQYNLGIMNYTGQTGGQDYANAAKWFERAANNGHSQAQYNLGFLYYEGKGVEQNLKTAFDWINRAAEQGYGKAITARDAFKKAMPEMFPADPKFAPNATPKKAGS
ncbi:MAG: hypothetical protein NWR87_07405 [Rhodospirillales bacterium]|nr:hypothetical protein [Rhodospirillales bacterium]